MPSITNEDSRAHSVSVIVQNNTHLFIIQPNETKQNGIPAGSSVVQVGMKKLTSDGTKNIKIETSTSELKFA